MKLLRCDLQLRTNVWTFLLSVLLHHRSADQGFEFSFPGNEFYLPRVQFFCHIFYDGFHFFLNEFINVVFGNVRFTPYNTQETKKSTNNDEGTLHCCHVLLFSTVKKYNVFGLI